MTPTELSEFRVQTEKLHKVYTSVFETVDILLRHQDPLSQNSMLNEINFKMEEVRQIERRIAPIRESLADKNEPIPEDLSAKFASITNIIEELLPRINQLEEQARVSKDKLSPGISEAARTSQMQQAYAKNAQ